MTNQSTPTDSRYDIRSCDLPLLDAVQSFGQWLLVQPETARYHKLSILKTIEAISCLPDAAPPNFNGEFEVQIEPEQRDTGYGIVRGWYVIVYRGLLEIFSIYSPQDIDSLSNPLSGHEFEDHWHLEIGKKNHNYDPSKGEWINEVSKIRSLVPDKHIIVVNANFDLLDQTQTAI